MFGKKTVSSDWKLYTGPVDVRAYGLSAGLDSLGYEVYIGRGVYNGYLTPGRILIETIGSKTPGVYIEYGGNEPQITSNIEYYAKNPKCNIKWVASSGGVVVPNSVKVPTINSLIYNVGRVFAEGSVHVGKVFPNYRLIYENGLTAAFYEVLVCEG